MKNFLFSFLFISFCWSSFAQQFQFVSPLQSDTDILKYNLFINLNFEKRSIDCSNVITAVKSNFNNDSIELDFYDNLIVQKVSYNYDDLKYKRKNNKIFIDISSVREDTFKIEIKYSGKPKKFGLLGFVFAELKEQKIIQTINQPNYAPSWFPCDDDPSDKAKFEIQIENDSDFVSVSNGKLISVYSSGKRKKFHYKSDYPISTNLIGFYSANYQVIEETYLSISGKELKLNYFVFNKDFDNAVKDLSETKLILQTFENLFGEYPFLNDKYSISEIIFGRGAIENQTLVGISKDLFSGKLFHKDVFIHEMAHSWWGNAVGIESWKDNWLSEGFATYSEALFYEYHFGISALNSFMNKFLSENLSARLYDPDDIFSPQLYYKGAWVIHMIRKILTDSIFFNFIKHYHKQFRYSTVSTKNFEKFLANYSGLDFSDFFYQWVYQDNEIINCTYHYNRNEGNLHVIQNGFVFKFSLDIKIIYDNSSEDLISAIVDKTENKISLPSDKNIKEIILDPQMKLLAKFRLL